ncbi:peptidoglycan-binding domain-containing protein [Roseibium sp.]|uniref:peptidoglycan-binding domain-containing protein n=1 Tax=Roseibium sp. TaxID=1936156 RepID=UPI003D125AD0
MKKLIASVAIAGLLSATALTSRPAQAGSGGAAIAGGVVGFAAGAFVGSRLAKNRGQRGTAAQRGGGYNYSGSGLALQRDLATLGFDPGPLDGRPGSQTNAALVAYQQTYGETPDATLDPSERRRLSARAMMASMPITYGDRDYWRHIQASLYLNGLDAGSFDGRPGRTTKSAIQQYQFRNNYAPTGELTPDQAQALLQSAHNSLAAAPQQNWAAQPGQLQPGQVQPGLGQQGPTVVTLPSGTADTEYEEPAAGAAQSTDLPTGQAASVSSGQPGAAAAEAEPEIHVDANGKPYIIMQGVKFYIQAAPATGAPDAGETPATSANKLQAAKTAE